MDPATTAENFNVLLAVPSLLVFAVILVLLCMRRWRALLAGNTLVSILLALLLLMNLIEVITYGNLYRNYEALIRAYYFAATASASVFLLMSEKLNRVSLFPRKKLGYVVVTLTVLLELAILFSDGIIAGYTRTSFTILREPGSYYWVFQLYSLATLTLAPWLIYRSIGQAGNPLEKRRHIVILFAFIPICLMSIGVILAMQGGLNMNLSIYLPIGTLFFFVIYLFTENKHNLFRLLVFIPFSRERAAYLELNERVIGYIARAQTNEVISLRELMHDIEKSIIADVLEIKDGNHSLAAEMLSVSLSTVYRNKQK